MEIGQIEDKLDYRVGGKRILTRLIGRQPVPNIVEMVEDLIAHITPPIKLTRRTLDAIVTGIKSRQSALDNPQEFASQAARVMDAGVGFVEYVGSVCFKDSRKFTIRPSFTPDSVHGIQEVAVVKNERSGLCNLLDGQPSIAKKN